MVLAFKPGIPDKTIFIGGCEERPGGIRFEHVMLVKNGREEYRTQYMCAYCIRT
jgi:hypothetical protein